MEVREAYIARILSAPTELGFTEAKFIHAPQVIASHSARLRCQYLCSQQRQSALCPPFSPTHTDMLQAVAEYRFGLLLRREVQLEAGNHETEWAAFHAAVLAAERESFRRGYARAFALAIGNCVHHHWDDDCRPCDFPGKSRPTLEAVGISVPETLDVVGWSRYLVRREDDPFQMLAILLLE